MKKSILIICTALTTFSLTALSYIWAPEKPVNNRVACKKVVDYDLGLLQTLHDIYAPELWMNVGNRFANTVTKEKLHSAKSIVDIVPDHAMEGIRDCEGVVFSVLIDQQDEIEMGDDEFLTPMQLGLAQNTDYGSNILIAANCQYDNPETGKPEFYQFRYYMTVVSHTQAQFPGGNQALIDFLKTATAEEMKTTTKDGLRPGSISFTVGPDGKIQGTKLESTGGYESLDNTLLGLIQKTDGMWEPAVDKEGNNISQELRLSFGKQGC